MPARASGSPKKTAKRRFPQINHKLAALGVFVGVSAAVLIAIQVLGDPSAAGPKHIIDLNPSVASADTAAPRVSFADASAQGQQLQPPDMAPDDTTTDTTTADGELRVAVVESPNQTPSTPAVSPLPRAPIAGLFESGPHGPMPIVARDGRNSAQAYARPFQPDGHPIIAVIIGGLGFNARTSTQAIEELPPEITLSFAPYATDLQTWINSARAHGHEVMLELPMEPFDPDADDTGPQTLLASAPAQQNVSRLEQLLSYGAGYFGVTNYQGARFATSSQASQPIAQALRRRGLVFISSGLGQRTALSVEATRAGLANTAADRIIDARREADAIDEQLLNLEALALQNRSAIGAGFAYPVTMEQVGRWARDIGTRGYQLAPASAVLRARAAQR
ncbi:MAG TPA: divergent polysaccharide deacetylase family protein [Caulobacterales bacterium]|nr:divergent polysaccharide deacetylase family protein [Caulobacterales bacterium]